MKRYLLIIFLSVFCGGVVSAQSTGCAESWKKAENREPLTDTIAHTGIFVNLSAYS